MNDIPPPAQFRAFAPEQVSRPLPPAEGPLPQAPLAEAPPPPPPPARRLRRAWRVVLALSVVGVAGVALLRQQLTIATEHAVISAYSIPLRTPIGGEVVQLEAQAGEALAAGTLLARVENPLADRRRLAEAAAERDRAMDEMAALAAQLVALDALADGLARRAAEHREQARRMLAAEVEEGQRLQAAAEARARRSLQEASRTADLARGGIAPVAQRDRAEAEREAALNEAAALAARGEALRAQEAAASRGLFLAGGHAGVGYLEQRLDEVALRRAEVLRQHAAQEAAAGRALLRTQEEAARHELEREARLSAGADLHVWRILARRGQRVMPEEVVAELTDCRDVFVLAAVAQSDVPAIAPGQAVRIRLAGETAEQPGVVLGWLPDAMAQEGGRLAALPSRPRGGGRIVQIGIAPPEPGSLCPVGRTGRVLFDRPGALPAWW